MLELELEPEWALELEELEELLELLEWLDELLEELELEECEELELLLELLEDESGAGGGSTYPIACRCIAYVKAKVALMGALLYIQSPFCL